MWNAPTAKAATHVGEIPTVGRFVKVDLTQEECEAVHALCDLTNVMLEQVGSTISKRARETLRVKLNTVRYKMGAAATLFGTTPGLSLPAALSLDLAKRDKH